MISAQDLDPANYTACKRRQFFFAKHCAVAMFLRARPPGFAAIVLDGDTYAVAPAIPLDKWLADGADVVLYEREWTFECRRRGIASARAEGPSRGTPASARAEEASLRTALLDARRGPS